MCVFTKMLSSAIAVTSLALALSATAETAIPASAYVQDGLVAQWDGIENAGAGTHDNAVTTWTDLSGNGNDLTGITSYGTFTEDGFQKSTKGSKKYSLGLAPQTYEVVCDFSNYSSGWIIPISTTSTYYPTFHITGSAGNWTLELFYGASNKKLPVFGGFSVKLQEKGRLTITCCHYVNPDNASDNFVRFYINGVEVDNNYSNYWGSNEDSVFGAGSVGHTSQNTVGHKFCAIRLYGRALPPVEIAHNAQLDAVRFSSEDGYRYNEDTQKIEYRILAETDGDGAVKVGDGGWMTAVTNWVEMGVPETYWFSALPSEGSTFAFWRITASNISESEIEYSADFSKTVSGPTDLRAVFRDERSMRRWVYLTSAESGGAGSAVISNAVTKTVLKVTASGTNLTITGVFANGDDVLDGAKTLDLSTPVESLDGATQYAITAINASTITPLFRSGAENLYLPETLKKIVQQLLDCHGAKSSIRRVWLPSGMTDLSSATYAFRGCTNLVEVLPAGVLESGRITAYATSIFYNCTSLTNCPNLVNAVKAPETFMYSCKSAVGNPHIENLETISSGAFNGCKLLTFDDPQMLPKLKEVASGSAFNGTTIGNLDIFQSPVTKLYVNGAAELKSVSPMLPTSVQSFSFNGCKSLTGDVVVASADCASIPENAFNGTMITSCDMADSSVEQFGKNAFYSCSALTNVVIPRTFNLFKTETPFSGGALTHVRFMGDVPAIDATAAQFSGCTKMAYYVPYWNESWEGVLSANGEEMAAADVTTFRENHPGEPVPVQKLNLDGRSGAKPVSYWVVDPPTETTRGPLSFFETLRVDGVQANVSHPLAFDGTTYALGAGDLMCTCSDDEIVIAMPEAATLTRSLKLTAYRIHQMSAGEHPNGRAPTAWILYGKRTDDGNWAEIDRVTMTAESANKWAFFGTDSDEIPPRSMSALTYQLSIGAAACYVAFKFVPTSSYLLQSGAGVDSPIGFGEIELLGEMVGAEPVIGSFAVANSGWKAVTFDAELLSHGEGAAWTRGTVELSTTSDFAEIAARSAATDLVAGGIVPITVSGLEAGVAYYARLKVENDAGGTDERSLEGTVSSLAVPFELAGGMFPAPTKGAYGFTVSADLAQLATSSATVELYYAPDGVTYGATPLQTKVIDEPGTVTFDPFPSDEPFAFVKIRIVTEEGGVTYENEYVRSVHEIWLGNAVSVTAISNTVKGIVLKCSMSGTNVTVSGITDYNGQTVFDLTLPVCDGVCKPLAITSVGTTFQGNRLMTELYLPDTISTIGSSALDQWSADFGNESRLERLRLPNTITSLTSYNFRGMRQLVDCENLLPKSLTTLGTDVFSWWSSVTNDIHFYEAFRTFGGKNPFPYGWTNVKRVYFHGQPADPTTGVFAQMTTLTFFVPRFEESWEKFLAESCETRALTAEDRAAFRAAYPGERMPKMMVKMPAGASKWRYLQYWYPDPKKRPGMLISVK